MRSESGVAGTVPGAAADLGGGPPAISVVMTTFNAERFVSASLDAVLQQEHCSFELVVYDDGSTDSTRARIEAASDPRLRLVGQQRIGRAAALNAAVRACRGSLISINDADDLSLPFRLSLAERALERDPDAVLVGSRVRTSHRFGSRPCEPAPEVPCGDARPIGAVELYRRNPFVHSTVTFRRSAWSAIGGYDERLPMCVDYDLFLRMAALGRLLMLPQVTLEQYIHPDSYFKSRPQGEYLSVLLRVRRRARDRLHLPPWARVFDLVPYLQAARAGILRQ